MAHEDRTSAHFVDLLRQLQESPSKFTFFQAVRELDRAAGPVPRTGRSQRPGDEPIRLAQEVAMTFAPSSLSGLELGRSGQPHRLLVRFLGLHGPQGPLPIHLTEYAFDRIHHHDDETLARFLDVFHHRMLSLFYRAWSQSQPSVQFDRPEDDRFGDYVGSVCGIGAKELRDRDDMPDLAKLYFAGRLANRTRNADGLRAILSEFFAMPVRIQEFMGQWIELPADCRCALGVSPQTATIGVNSTIGQRYWDCQQKFRLVFGPIGYDDYRRLLPGGESLKKLTAVVRNYLGDELQWDVQLILKREGIPSLRLGQAGELGWTDWIHAGPAARDADDLRLDQISQRAG